MRPSALRVARAWDNELLQGQANLFRAELQRFNTAVQTRDRLVAYRWADVIRRGSQIAGWLLETRSIPRGKEKAAELAFRLFMSAARTPRDVFAWAEKNEKHLVTFLDALGWPEKSAVSDDSEEVFPFEGFTIHNTLNLTGPGLETTKDVIKRAVRVLHTMTSVPRVTSIIYGNLFVVGRLKQPRTLAWYNQLTDEVYLRPHIKVGSEESHNLLHELGHRYWFKVMSREARSAWATYHMLLQFQRPEVPMPGPGDVFPIPIKGQKKAPIVERVEGGQIFFVGGGSVPRLKTMQILQQKASYPTDYASTSAEEHFAESFAMYGLGDLQAQHVEAFEAIVIRGEKYQPGRMAARVAARHLTRPLSAVLKMASDKTLQDLVSDYFGEVGKHLASAFGGTKTRLNDKSELMVKYLVDWNTPGSPDQFNFTAVFTLERGFVLYSVFQHTVGVTKPRLMGKQTISADVSASALAELVGRVVEDAEN